MKYYHVFIQSLEREGLCRQGIIFDNSKEDMIEFIISPFNEKKPFKFGERLVNLKKIDRVIVFESEIPTSEIVLPNGETPHKSEMTFLIHSFCEGEVEGVRECTSEYIPQPKSKSKTA
jgi:hypothetical protein